MTLPATNDDDGGETVRYVKVSDILTPEARKRSQELDARNWQALHDELMRRLCA